MRATDIPADNEQEGTRPGTRRLRGRLAHQPGRLASASGGTSDLQPSSTGATGQINRRKFLLAETVGAALLGGSLRAALLSGSSQRARASATPATSGQWTAPFAL